VTGRIGTELASDFPQLADHADALVLENGAVAVIDGQARPLVAPVDSALDGELAAHDIAFRRGQVALAVDFVLVQLGQSHQPIAGRLADLGTREARFGELFNGGELDAALDEHIEFFDGMPIFTVLPVVGAIVDDFMPASRLNPWSVAEVIHTMLPTNSGMAVASALDSAGRPGRQLVSADRLDRDCLDVGLAGIPGHPALVGRAGRCSPNLDNARAALAGVSDEVFTVRAGD